MRFSALVTDYDGTLAHDGHVDEVTRAALERLRQAGRKVILVTGRELGELKQVFPDLWLFDRIVAENGALLLDPWTNSLRPLADPPPAPFVEALIRADVKPLSVGQVIVATREPHHIPVLETIRKLGLQLQVIFNKGSVMVLPSGVNKATGLLAALEELGLASDSAVGIGDAENDHAFLSICGYSVAVSNALTSLKDECDWITTGARGAGVTELIDRMIGDSLPARRRQARNLEHPSS
jgi:hydroxymethylpyrimidine pyrophosphatase-like HAD family hydrolase